MKHVASKAKLAVLIGTTLTAVSLNVRIAAPAHRLDCLPADAEYSNIALGMYSSSYIDEGYPFTIRQVSAGHPICNSTHYFELGAVGDEVVWSLVGFPISLATYPLLSRMGRHVRLPRIGALQK